MDMPRETILRAGGVSKLYARRNEAMRQRLAQQVSRALFGGSPRRIHSPGRSEFWALDEVSFELKRGEALGVIGLNGSGKTTLLRLLAGQILPDCGEVWISGSSAAMIDLHAGFQPSETGRQNIYLRAAALGFTRNQTEAMLDEIIAFAELGDAIDGPMANYSSGMKMRLAFSVMAMVQPDILFIDEVLAVGDFRFRSKCLARIREMRERSAFVFVSHSMGDISRFCDRVIVLHKGRVYFEGTPQEAIQRYEALTEHTPVAAQSQGLVQVMGPTMANRNAIDEVEHYWCDERGMRMDAFDFRDRIRLLVRFRAAAAFRNLNIGVPIWNMNATYTTGLSTEITLDKVDTRAGEIATFILEIDGGHLNPGTLKSMMSIVDGPEFLYRQPNPDLIVRPTGHPTWGAVTVPHRWRKLSPPIGAQANATTTGTG